MDEERKLTSTLPATESGQGTAQAAIIRQLTIDRFRGIKHLKWNPAAGLNILLGGGDVGKTTVLEAIALLLNPWNSAIVSESDYYDRVSGDGFVIQAVLSLPNTTDIGQQQKFSWPWEWNGEEAIPPLVTNGEPDDTISPEHPVYRLRVRGSSDLELFWEIVQPNDEIDTLSSAVRRAIGVLRLGSDDRNDRDLRLVYGSALDRLLADQGLKARIAQLISEMNLNEKLSVDAEKSLKRLDDALREESLPSGLELGLTSAQGISLGALIGLLAKKRADTSLPLASWGAGTRRMATLEIAAATQSKTRITIIDEVERGLEPYRVRKLIESLQGEATQSFVTTHSPVAISTAGKSSLWYMDKDGNLGRLERDKIKRQQVRDPETFLARLAIIAEGPTEVGFASYFLEKAIKGALIDHGIRVCNGEGTPAVLDLLEVLKAGRLTFGGFVDNDGKNPGRWATLKMQMGDLLFQWISGCTEERLISLIDDEKLPELIKNAEGKYVPMRRRSLAERLGTAEKDITAILAAKNLREVVIAAATGSKDGAPDDDTASIWKNHGKHWFKTEEGGRELAEKVLALGVWPQLKPALMPFLNAVRSATGQPQSDDLAS